MFKPTYKIKYFFAVKKSQYSLRKNHWKFIHIIVLYFALLDGIHLIQFESFEKSSEVFIK